MVITLALVVMVTFLLMALYSRAIAGRQLSDAFASSEKATGIEQMATATILADLRQEIMAGSTATTSATSNSTTIFYPTTPAAAVPYRTSLITLSGSNQVNLVKWSVSGVPFFDQSATYNGTKIFSSTYPPSNRAAQVSTSWPTKEGRFVSAGRWNAPLLLTKTDLTSIAGPGVAPAWSGGNATFAPDWVYVTRNGSNPQAFSPDLPRGGSNPVLGRYAYAIYDEGGVLDVNVAGYPSSMDGAAIQKGSLGFASLRSVLTQAGFGNAVSASDALVNWRNAATLAGSGGVATRYYRYLFAPKQNFLKVSTDKDGQPDRAFVSRQALLNFMRNQWTDSMGTLAQRQNALQYLGTFSRDLQQPSYKPPQLTFPSPTYSGVALTIPDPSIADATQHPRPAILPRDQSTAGRNAVLKGGNNNAGLGLEDKINPAFLDVRVATGFTRASDGTTAKIGEPLVKYRFPLSRLAWLTCDGPAAGLPSGDSRYNADGTATKITQSFGLTWDATNKWWTYDPGNADGIYTLGALAALGVPREPDFIELLQAGINVGSLGKGVTEPSAGPLGNKMACARKKENDYNNGFNNELIPALPEFQVLQIAASIIDQADTDGYPTEIRMQSPVSGNTIAVYGDENLPLINRVFVQVATRASTGANDPGGFGFYFVPELWNPHQSSMPPPSGPTPTRFRIGMTCTNKQNIYSIHGFLGNGTTGTSNNWSFKYTDSSGAWSGMPGVSGNGTTSYTFDSTYPGFPFPAPTQVFENKLVPPSPKAGTTWEVSAFPLIKFDPWRNLTTTGNNTTGIFFPIPGQTDGVFTPTAPTSPTPGNATDSIQNAYKRITGNNTVGTATNPSSFPELTAFDVDFITSCPGFTFSLEFWDGSIWREFNTFSNIVNNGAVIFFGGSGASAYVRYMSQPGVDPRSDRFPQSRSMFSTITAGVTAPQGVTARPDYTGPGYHAGSYLLSGIESSPSPGWKNFSAPVSSNAPAYALGLISQNTIASKSFNSFDFNTFYADPDGVIRGGDAMYATVSDQDMVTTASNPNPGRPIILNRPFRSVGELGYVFRGQPFKTIDFFSNRINRPGSNANSGTDSGDTALLDVFCISEPSTDTNGMIAGALNLNTQNVPVLQALLSAGSKTALLDEAPGASASFLSPTDEQNIATKFVDATKTCPATNLSDIVSRVIQGQAIPSDPDCKFKRRREAPVRLLSAGTTTRVWNLMIDIIAQTGMLPPTATDLKDFTLQGERRVWVHLAIDRLTGKVLDSQIERVTE